MVDQEQPTYTIELLIELLRDMEEKPEQQEDAAGSWYLGSGAGNRAVAETPGYLQALNVQPPLNDPPAHAAPGVGGIQEVLRDREVFLEAVNQALEKQKDVQFKRAEIAIQHLEQAWYARQNTNASVDAPLTVDMACMKAHTLLNEDSPMSFRFSLWAIAGERFEEWCKTNSPTCHRAIKCINFPFPSRLYYNSVRLRIAFFGFITSVIMVACQAGILIETFMSVFTPLIDKQGSSKLYGYFVFLPVIVCWSAFILEGLLELSMDAANGIPLVHFQAAFLQGLKFLTWPRFLIVLLWLLSGAASLAEAYFYHPYHSEHEAAFSTFPAMNPWPMIRKMLSVLLVPSFILAIFRCRGGNKWEDIKKKLKEAVYSWETTLITCRSVSSILYVILVVLAPAVCSSAEHLFISGPLGFCLMMTHNDRENPKYHFPFKWERRTVDITGFFLLEIIPISNGIRGAILMHNAPDGRGWWGAFFQALFWGAVFCIVIAAIILQTSTVFMLRNSSKDWHKKLQKCCGSWIDRSRISEDGGGRTALVSGRAPRPAHRGIWSREYFKRWSVLLRKKAVAPGMLAHMDRTLFEAERDVPDLGTNSISVAHHDYEQREYKIRTPLWISLVVLNMFSLFAYILHGVTSSSNYGFHWLTALWLLAIEASILRSAFFGWQVYAFYNDCFRNDCNFHALMFYLSIILLLFLLPVLPTPEWTAGAFAWERVGQPEVVICTSIVLSLVLSLRDFRDTMPLQIRKWKVHPHFRLFACWVVWVLALVLADSKLFEHPLFFLCPTFLLTAFTTSFWFSAEFPGSVGRVYWFVSFGFYCMFASLLISANFKLGPFQAAITVSQTVKDSSYLRSYVNVKRNASYQYGLCEFRYGHENAQLSALDLAQLAGLTYEKECYPNKAKKTNIAELLDLTFKGTQFKAKLTNCSDYDKTFPRYAVFDIYNSAGNGNASRSTTRVIAFKGTSDMKDLYTDAMFYSAVKVLQWTSVVLPVMYVFAVAQMQWFFYGGHLPAQWQVEQEFWSNLEGTIVNFTNEGSSVILTGHSLGGAFAQVMAAKLNLPALVWSSPGVLYSADRFGIHDRDFWGKWTKDKDHTWNRHGHEKSKFGVQVLKSRVRNVIPRFDQVPLVDEQLCLVEHISCRDKDKPFGTAMSCHSLERTACELWRVCGDPQNRVHDCHKFFKPEDINSWRIPDDYQ